MPTSSSLVTNLPADFNTFGQGVDTSLQDLLGGTTGQVLSKASGTNMDFSWVTPTDQTPLTTKGDLFAFSTLDARLPAGANETRLVADSAQTLGLKYVADTTNYAIAAKADLLVGTAADTLAALTVGTNGQVLTADSTVSPTGLKWADATSPSYTWTSWTPTYTNLTVGNGTVTAKYIQIGKLVTAYWKIVFGSTTSVAGSVDLTLPINAVAEYAYTPVGYAKSNADEYFMGGTALNNKWKIQNMIASGSFVYPSGISSTSPNNWTTGNYITLWASYEVA